MLNFSVAGFVTLGNVFECATCVTNFVARQVAQNIAFCRSGDE